jgi:hypothetical protein
MTLVASGVLNNSITSGGIFAKIFHQLKVAYER